MLFVVCTKIEDTFLFMIQEPFSNKCFFCFSNVKQKLQLKKIDHQVNIKS